MQAADYELSVFRLKTYALASGVYRLFVHANGSGAGSRGWAWLDERSPNE